MSRCWIWVLFAIGLCGCGSIALQAPPFDATPPHRKPLPGPPLADRALQFVVQSTFASNLFHWVDNLAGSSFGKNRTTYVNDWLRVFGALDPQQKALLAEFARVRTAHQRRKPGFDRAPVRECLPVGPLPLTRRQQMLVVAAEAESVDDLIERLAVLVDPSDAEHLAAALRAFEPGVRKLQRDAAYLGAFRDEFERFLNQPRTQQLLAAYGRFFALADPAPRPVRISLVAMLHHDLGTHAEANGDDLLLEIRPMERPVQQAAVVFHEISHVLWSRLTADRQVELISRFYRQGQAGLSAWLLAREALPTALGQGLAQAILAPNGYSWADPWYHDPDVDLAAHLLYPQLRFEFFAGHTLFDALPEKYVQRVARSRLGQRIPPLAQLVDGILAVPSYASPMLVGPLRQVRTRNLWELNPGLPSGERFLRQASCLPLIGFATVDDLSSLSIAREEGVAVPQLFRPLPNGVAGIVVPLVRPSGAAALWVIAASDLDVPRAVEGLAQLKGWPRSAVLIRR